MALLIIGDANSPDLTGGFDPRAVRLDLLEPETAARLVTPDGGLAVPWELALGLLDLFEGEERREDIERHLPRWLTPDDLEILLQALLAAWPPRTTPLRLQIVTDSAAGKPGYRVRAEWCGAGGRFLPQAPTVRGGLVRLPRSNDRRLTLGQYGVLRAIAALPALGTARDEDLRATALVLGRVPRGDPGVVLEEFLQNESYVVTDRVQPRFAATPDGDFAVLPRVEGVPAESVERYFEAADDDELGRKAVVIPGPDQQRTRVVFGPQGRAALQDVRHIGRLTPDEVAHALSHPAEVLGENIDTSVFSERVIGLGPAIRTVIPSIRDIAAGDWWDWDYDAVLEEHGVSDAAPPPRISLKDPATRAALRESLARADARGDTFVPTPDGKDMLAITPELRRALDEADALEREAAANGGKLPKRPREVLRVRENLESLDFDRAAASAPVPLEALPPPPGLLPQHRLRAHQDIGYAWLAGLQAEPDGARAWHGALLADDMGLGKTLQVLSYLAHIGERGRTRPHLIVAPVVLLTNWQREAHGFFGGAFEPMLEFRSAAVGKTDRAVAAARLAAHRLVLVSYETLRRNERLFALVDWDTVVLDEAQKAKDPTTEVARVVRTLKARFRLAMTGTPVENSLKELWTVYDWAVPGLLGSLREFAAEYVRPLRDADEPDRKSLASRLHAKIAPVFLRRMKAGALGKELPPLERHDHRVALAPAQELEYARCLRDRANTSERAQLAFLIRLLGICAHPELGSDGGFLTPVTDQPFPKGQMLFELLDGIVRRGEKALIFANRRRLQHWLSHEIEARHGVPVGVINGEVGESTRRQGLVDEFSDREGFAALVLAPRAAGVGLNITAANHVIHYTREWNPAVEAQATDRAYRIGQKRPVHVHTLTTTSPSGATVEQRLSELLDEKRRLMTDFVVPMGGFEITASELNSRL